jgi:HD-GYP domain-containing protein (c-di-GMP phosphodiesterase class II)
VAIADVFDALYSDRPYRKAYSLERVMEIMREMTATHFDPELIKTFLPLAEQEACIPMSDEMTRATVLFVDDEENILKALQRLTMDEEFDTEIAAPEMPVCRSWLPFQMWP